MELCLIYVATHKKPKLTVGQTFNNAHDFQKEGRIMGTELKAADFVPVVDSTGETVSQADVGARAYLSLNCSSYVTQPVSATKRILYIYLRYSCPLLGHFSSIALI
jgi:hypothetical protein